MDPLILNEFDALTPASADYNDFIDIHDGEDINNEPAKYARIIQVNNDKRVLRRMGTYDTFHDYRLKWTNKRKTSVQTTSVISTRTTNANGYTSTAYLRGI